jgi:hypothetical protein
MLLRSVALPTCVSCLVLTINCLATGDQIILSDLAKLVDAGALSDTDLDSWRAIPYESERFAGVMIGDGGGTMKPIAIRLGQTGTYRIHLGVYGGWGYPILRLRLEGEEAAQTVEVPAELQTEGVHDSSTIIYETVWKDAELAGQSIILEAAADAGDFPAALAYIRLEPIDRIGGEPLPTGEPQAAPQAQPGPGIDPARKVAYPLAITEDGHGIFGESVHSRPEDLLAPFDEIPDGSCLRMLLWGNGEADICNYPTRVGSQRGPSGFRDAWYSIWNQNIESWKRDGWDSLKMIRDYTRRRNWELQVYIRMEAFKSPFPFDRMVRSDFFEAHPEYHCLDRHGQRIARLSYAYPEVQDHMLALVREIAGYDPDGVCFCFIRGVPVVQYEPIMVDGFRQKYGVDPRELGETDRRWLGYQGQVVTAFMRKAKSALNGNQRLSVIVPGNRFDCEKWGLDVAEWLREGLVDDLFPTGQVFSKRDVHLDGPENLDFEYFNHLEGRQRLRLMPMLYPWDKFSTDFPGWRADMCSFLRQGANGYAVWDGRAIISTIGDIGYEGESTGPRSVMPSAQGPRKLRLKTLQGFRMDRYHYFEVI